MCLLLARPFFLVPTTSKRLLRRLLFLRYTAENFEVTYNFKMLLPPPSLSFLLKNFFRKLIT